MSTDASFVIVTQQNHQHEWMAFACWYSIHRNLPENKVAVVFPRSSKHHQYTWLNKCHVPYLTYPTDATPEQAVNTLIENKVISSSVIVIQDHHMIIRDIEDNVDSIVTCETLPFYANCDSENGCIVDYTKCGKFILDEWLEKEQKHPFYNTSQFMARNRTVNEQRVFQLWKQMGATFDF